VLRLQEGLLAAQEALRRRATHDDLTGLWNRGMILERLTHEVSRARREHTPLSVAMADLDHFKQINDTHGHAAGDAVLRYAAHRLRDTLRDYDCLGRYGGEEFLLVVPKCDAAAAIDTAERLRAAVAVACVPFGSSSIPVTVSVGVASTDAVGYDEAALMRAADAALYEAKAGGRNRVAA
jgi:diguanylate cyclase (GGDEF)-like protein